MFACDSGNQIRSELALKTTCMSNQKHQYPSWKTHSVKILSLLGFRAFIVY
jgi:hypothetical protein